MGGWVLRESLRDSADHLLAVLHLGGELFQRFHSGVSAEFAYGLHLGEATAELHHFAREDLACGGAGDYALKVTDIADFSLYLFERAVVVVEELHAVEAGVQLGQVHARQREPLAQQAGAHWRAAAVDGLDQADAIFARRRCEDLEVADGEFVHPHELRFVYTADAADILKAYVLGLLEVENQRAGGAYAQREGVDREALQALHAELLAELFVRGFIDKGPFVHAGDVVIAETLFHRISDRAVHDEFLRLEGRQQSADIIKAALRHLEGAGAGVQEGRAADIVLEIEAAEIIVLFLVQHAFAEGHAGRKYLCHTAFNKLVFRKRGVLQLVANCDLIAGAD